MKLNTLLVTGFLLLTLQACKKSDPAPGPGTNNVNLGVVLDLSGPYSEEGKASLASLEFAIQDLNQLYAKAGSGTRFACTVIDSHMDTMLALKAVESLYNQGVRLLAGGPSTSAELGAIKNFIDNHSMLDLDCFSTAPSLAIPGDNIFRLIPDDNMQGQALVRMMQYDGIEALVPVWRNDNYGRGLAQSVRVKFSDLGKTVMPGLEYGPDSVDFSTVMNAAALQVNDAAAIYGPSHVALLLVAFEASEFFVAASAIQGLDLVKWYGCDANSQKTPVITNPVSSEFAEKVRFLAPVMAIGTATSVPAQAKALSDRIFAATGLYPDDMALSAYDAVMIFGQCYNLTGKADPAAIKAILPAVCSSYDYLGINRSLNDAGDLSGSNFIFWTVKSMTGGRAWVSYATWYFSDNRIIIKP